MEKLKTLFEHEEKILIAADDLINGRKYQNDPLIEQFINLAVNFGKILKEFKKIIKISDGQQEYLQQIQNNLKTEIEERAKVERELAFTADKLIEMNTLKDRLFTIVSHDIRDPLAVLVSLTELLEDEKAYLSHDSREIIETVKEQVSSTYSMVENLLEWFRSQKGGMLFNPLVWELSRIINDTVRIFKFKCDAKNIQVITEIRKGIMVYADRDALELVIRNLLSNAIKFTKAEGSIFIRATEPAGNIIIYVTDTGIGIEAEKIPNLFKEAQMSSSVGTAGEKGTGLGLLICKEFVKHNGGEIWLESTLGKGSTFYFSVPAGNDGAPNKYEG